MHTSVNNEPGGWQAYHNPTVNLLIRAPYNSPYGTQEGEINVLHNQRSAPSQKTHLWILMAHLKFSGLG